MITCYKMCECPRYPCLLGNVAHMCVRDGAVYGLHAPSCLKRPKEDHHNQVDDQVTQVGSAYGSNIHAQLINPTMPTLTVSRP